MAKRRINELFDEQAIKAQIAKLKGESFKFLDELDAKLQGMAGTKVSIGGANNFKELNTAQQAYNAYIKDTDNIKKQLLASEKKLQEAESTYTKLIAANRVELQKKNAELKNQAQYENANTGSIDKARAAVALLNKERNKLNLYTEEGRAKQEQLNAQINKYNAFIKNSVDLLSQQKINIGNYAGSLAKPFETLINKVEELKANLKNGIGLGGKTDVQSLQQAGVAITIIEQSLSKSSAKGTTSVKQVKDLSNAYRDLSVTLGKADGTTFLSTLQAEVGQAKDEVADLNDELKLAASDTKGIDNVVGSLNALAGIAQGAAGAYALLGASEEDAAKVTSKLIAVQGIANSIQQVGQELTRKGTIANKAYVFVQGLVATATNTTATASARLNAVLKLSTIGLVVAAIGGLIYLFSRAGTATGEFADRMKLLNELNTKAAESAGKESAQLTILKASIENTNLPMAKRLQSIKDIREQYPEYFKGLTNEQLLTGNVANAYDLAAAAILRKARASAAASAIEEIAAKKIAIILKDQQDVEETNAALRSTKDITTTKRGTGDAAGTQVTNTAAEQRAGILIDREIRRKARQQEIDDENKKQAFLLKIAMDGANDVIKIDKVKAEAAAKSPKITDNTAQVILKEQFEQKKILLQQSVDADRKVFEDETQIFSDRLDALKTFTAGQINLINLETNFEIANEKIRLAGVLAGLEDQKKEKGANIKAINDQEAKETEASNEILRTIVLKGNDNILKVGEEFNKDLKDLKDARKALRKEEEQDLQDYEEFTMGWLKSFRQKQREANADWDKKDLDDKKKQSQEITSIAFRTGEEMQATLLFFLTASIDKEIATIDTRRRILDEDTQRRINQINLLGLKEQDRIKETAKVEKQAAFEREELERRRRKLLVERAKFEKIANIASIISSTAQAVVSALGSKPWTPLNIALAAAVGGIGILQLARAVAAPLPQYRKGTDSAKKGLALVSEEGPELMKRNGQLFLTPPQPTLMEMAGGEQITPAHLTRDILNSIRFSKNMRGNGMVLLQPSGISSHQADEMISELKDLKRETARTKISMHLHSDHGWNLYVTKNVKN